jgi:hypothetical protein
MVAAGISLRVVQDIGGWSTLRMLERYAHPSGAEMSRAVRVLTAYTTGTKTGTATKNGNGDRERTDAASAVKRKVTKWRPQRDSNPRFGLERATSWASGRWGREVRVAAPVETGTREFSSRRPLSPSGAARRHLTTRGFTTRARELLHGVYASPCNVERCLSPDGADRLA